MSNLRALRLPSLLVAVALAATACGSESSEFTAEPVLIKPGALTVCSDIPYEPFEFEKGGKPAGFDVDVVQRVADELELRLNMVDSDFDPIQNGDLLNSDKCDMVISAMTITGERARVLDFSSPYFNAAQAMVVQSSSDATSLDDLAGGKVGVQSGTTGELYVTDHKPDSTSIVAFEDPVEMTQSLVDGSIDAAVFDNTIVGQVIQDNPSLRQAAEFDTGEQYGMAVKKDGNVELLRTIDAVITELRDSGDYDKIYKRWFGDAKA